MAFTTSHAGHRPHIHQCANHSRHVHHRRQAAVCHSSSRPTALITGASSGIGREASIALAKQGWQVFSGVRTAADADSLRQAETGITPLLLDVSRPESIAAAQQEVQQQLQDGPGLNLLVNNAGVGLVAPAEFVPMQQWRQVLDVNLLGPLAVTQAFLPLLRQGQPQKGRIINISSVAGHLALPFWTAYNCSKAALDIFSECLRYELADQGISVILVKPGPVATPIWGKSRATSQGLLSDMPPEAQQLYGAALQKMNEMVKKSEEDAIPVDDVVRVIVEAATTQQPQPIYLVGKNAGLNYWAKRLMPDALWYSIIQNTLANKP